MLGRENEPVVLDHHSPALHLIQQIRDEAHRFAVTFHRARRTKREITTELLQIPGVGKTDRQQTPDSVWKLEQAAESLAGGVGPGGEEVASEAGVRLSGGTIGAESIIIRLDGLNYNHKKN